MDSSRDEAILIFRKWESNSSRLRMVLGTSHAVMTLHGKISSIAAFFIVCVGDDSKNEVRFNLADAASIVFADAGGLPAQFDFLKPLVVDDLISVTFLDGARLMVLNETAA